jgi:hypothetical protein
MLISLRFHWQEGHYAGEHSSVLAYNIWKKATVQICPATWTQLQHIRRIHNVLHVWRKNTFLQ